MIYYSVAYLTVFRYLAINANLYTDRSVLQ